MADIVEHYNGSDTPNAYGSEVSSVQIAAGAANGDIIKVSGNTTFTSGLGTAYSTNPFNVRTFTIQSANENMQTISVTSGRCYDLNTAAQNYNITIKNIFYQGDNTPTYCSGRFIIQSKSDSTLTLDLNNVTFKQFKGTNSGSNNAIGGVIRSNCPVSISGDNVKFIENSSCEGGALDVTAALTITVDNLSFENNSASKAQGGAIYSTGNTTITGNTLTFKNNTSTNHAGAIRVNNSSATLTIKGNSVTFDGNNGAGNEGGAICSHYLVMNGTGSSSVTTFKNNITKNFGGAICAYTEATFKTGSFYFDNNSFSTRYTTNGYGGGAMTTKKLTISDVNVLSFTKNNSAYNGGAINLTANGVANIEAKTIIFEDNVANDHGGAIHGGSGAAVSITGESISFARNSNKSGDGGAIRMADSTVNVSGKNADTVITFSANVSKGLGGAISASANLSNGQFTFENNSAGTYGGAIHGSIVAFSGDGTSAVFTGNTAVSGGNDLNVSTSLSFTDNGTYSFDGGIRLVNDDTTMTIDKSQVTVSGRANDATNDYQLKNVYISNGGKLTANLDYIDSLTGTFNVSGATEETKGTLELNVSDNVVKKLNADSFKVVRTDLGEVIKTGDGTLQLCNEAQDLIDINGLVISSGRMDILGYMTGGITVEPDSVFSPGNSVGDAVFGGGFILKEGATLLIEQDASGIDTLTATSFDIDSNSIIDFAADSLQPGASYDIIFQTDSEGNPKNFTGAQATDDYWNNLLTPESAYYWNLSVRGDTVYASVDANAVPEPSTWALLLLGAAGLLYVRKRTRK